MRHSAALDNRFYSFWMRVSHIRHLLNRFTINQLKQAVLMIGFGQKMLKLLDRHLRGRNFGF